METSAPFGVKGRNLMMNARVRLYEQSKLIPGRRVSPEREATKNHTEAPRLGYPIIQAGTHEPGIAVGVSTTNKTLRAY